MTPSDALANLIAIKNNELALADPTGALWAAQIAVLQSLVEAVSTQAPATVEQTVSSSPAAPEDNSAQIAALQAENAALTAKVAAGESAIDAFEATLHPQAPAPAVENSASDAAPSSSEPATIAPQAPGV